MSEVSESGISTRVSQIRAAFERAADAAELSGARRERRLEDIYYGDVPTFMELAFASTPEQLIGVDAAVMGFGYEGITIKTPSLSAPPTVCRPAPDSVYWRMGADHAPEAIRRYSLFYSVHHNRGWFPEIDRETTMLDQLKVVDYGDVDVNPQNTHQTLCAASQKVRDIVRAGALPLVLGGDHTVPIATLPPIVENRAADVGVIAFDAHMDLSYTDEAWASVEWAKTFELGKLRPENFVLIGIRSNRNTQYERQVADELNIRMFTIDEVKDVGMSDVISEAIKIASRGTDGLYVSLDIDCMEPSLVPGQKAPELWGLTIDELMIALRRLSRLDLIGFDICELSPDYDVNGMGAQFCARVVVELLMGLALRKGRLP